MIYIKHVEKHTEKKHSQMEQKKVVIVGAGIAGLRCAQKLHESGKFAPQDIIILEARDRYGGRIHTVDGVHGRYDLGASWHHDTLTNPLFKEEVAAGVSKYVFDDDYTVVVDSHGKVLSFDSELRLELLREECNKYIEYEFYSELDYPDTTYFEMINKYLFQQKQHLTDDQILGLYKITRNLELWHGIDWKSMSGKYSQVDSVGRNALCLEYDSVIERIVGKIPRDSIKLNNPITSIERRGKKVIVDGKYECDYCVVTVPQSVLSLSLLDDPSLKGRISFTPPLNKEIEESFQKIHYGALGKVIFEFEQPWSFKNRKIYYAGDIKEEKETGILGTIRNNNELTQDLLDTLKSLTSPFSYKDGDTLELKDIQEFPLLVCNYMGISNTPALMILTQNPLTSYLERIYASGNNTGQTINKLFEPILQVLFQKLSPETNGTVPTITNTVVSSWTVDPYSRGSYTACFPGDDPLDLSIMMERGQDSRIRFAGEHTINDGTGATYGASMSGEREARYIIQQL